jgi:hypothetical protein
MGKGSSKLTKEELKELEETSNFTAEELRGLYKGTSLPLSFSSCSFFLPFEAFAVVYSLNHVLPCRVH